MNKELIIVLDFGGQYNQLIARRVRECNVYAEVHPYTMSIDEIKKMNPKGIISPVDRIVYTRLIHQVTARKFLNWVFQSLESVMVHS